MLLILLAACAPPPYSDSSADTGDTSGSGQETGTDTTEEDTAPSIDITWPAEESSVVACTMLLVEIRNFELEDYGDGPSNEEGHGHYHVYYSTTFEACDAPYCLIDLTGLPDDGYVLTARLAENEHSPLLDDQGNYIEDSIAINLTAGTCEASMTGLP